MKYLIIVITTVITMGSCNETSPRPNHEAMKARLDSLNNDLLQTDVTFSELSEQKGRNAAFGDYAADGATLLRPYSMPVTGKDTIVNLLAIHPDSGYVLTWKPIRAQVARSGELGFTYGTYVLNRKNGNKEQGTYCTVWKKDKNHSWKFVLDTGNEGLSAGDMASDKDSKTAKSK